ncbi:MAG: hypothetical protein V1765_00820 [bacterium]
MKKIILLVAVLGMLVINFTDSSTAKTKSYYSGDAINYQGEIIIASTNTGKLELFALDNSNLNLVNTIQADDSKYNIFYDVKFDEHWDRLYVYVTSGRYLYKYDATDLHNISLVNKVKDNSWDWFGDIDKVEGQIVTKGTKFIKFWDEDLNVVNAYALVNPNNPYNIIFGYYNSNYIYNIADNKLDFYDRTTRKVTRSVELKYNQTTGNHRLHPDALNDMIYVIDDEALKKFSHVGGFYKSLPNESGFGYDVIYSTDGLNIYFSNGASVQKVSKGDFAAVSRFDNTSLKVDQAWAMGLVRVLNKDGQEMVVVFNNSNILVLDKNLQVVAKALATTQDDSAQSTEKLWLNLKKWEVQSNDLITVYGGGFAPNEDLTLTLERNTIKAKADNQGRFQTDIRVPLVQIKDGATELRTDLKVVGQLSGSHYSIGVIIKK